MRQATKTCCSSLQVLVRPSDWVLKVSEQGITHILTRKVLHHFVGNGWGSWKMGNCLIDNEKLSRRRHSFHSIRGRRRWCHPTGGELLLVAGGGGEGGGGGDWSGLSPILITFSLRIMSCPVRHSVLKGRLRLLLVVGQERADESFRLPHPPNRSVTNVDTGAARLR